MDFPSNPTLNQTYTLGDKTWKWNGSGWDQLATPATTDTLTEGSTNLYFTTARARSSISATGSLAYNSTSGVISYTQPTALSSFTNDSGYITSITSGNVTTALGYTPANKAGDTFSGSVSLNTTGSHLNFYESDAADPADRALIELNSNNLSLYGYDNSASTFRLFLSGNVTTGNVATNGSWTFTGATIFTGQIGLGGANYGTSGQVLTSQGPSAAPTWADASGGASGGASSGQALAFAIVFGL